MKYIVIELQTNQNGTVANLVFDYDNRNEAESKYHTILAAAAISNVPTHAAVMLASDGGYIAAQAYEHGEADE